MAEHVRDLLARHPFSQGFPEEDLSRLAALAQVREFSPGEYLLREGREAGEFYLLLTGHVAVELYVPERGLLRLQTLGPGDVVGWSWFLPPYRAAFDVRVIHPVQGIVLDASGLRRLVEEEASLGVRVLRQLVGVVAKRVHAARLQLLDVYGAPVGRRW